MLHILLPIVLREYALSLATARQLKRTVGKILETESVRITFLCVSTFPNTLLLSSSLPGAYSPCLPVRGSEWLERDFAQKVLSMKREFEMLPVAVKVIHTRGSVAECMRAALDKFGYDLVIVGRVASRTWLDKLGRADPASEVLDSCECPILVFAVHPDEY